MTRATGEFSCIPKSSADASFLLASGMRWPAGTALGVKTCKQKAGYQFRKFFDAAQCSCNKEARLLLICTYNAEHAENALITFRVQTSDHRIAYDKQSQKCNFESFEVLTPV